MSTRITKLIRCGKHNFRIKLVHSRMISRLADDVNVWGLFDLTNKTIWIASNINTKNKEAVLIHELQHLATWHKKITPSKLKRVKDPEELLITKTMWVFHKLLKQL